MGLSTRNIGTRLLRQGLVERFVLSGLKWHFEFLVFLRKEENSGR